MAIRRELGDELMRAFAEEDTQLAFAMLFEVITERAAEKAVATMKLIDLAKSTPSRLVPVPEAAGRLGRSVNAVYKMIERGQLAVVRRPGGHRVQVESSEIDRYIARNRTGASRQRGVI